MPSRSKYQTVFYKIDSIYTFGAIAIIQHFKVKMSLEIILEHENIAFKTLLSRI